MKRVVIALVAAMFTLTLFGCPVPVRGPGGPKPPPPGRVKPKAVPPGQVKRQQTPSGPKSVPPGQMKKHAPDVVVVAPPLPPIIEFDPASYFLHEGFYYFFVDGIWFYADSPGGKRVKLPKSHYPKEVKHKKGKGGPKDKGNKKGRK